MPKILLAELRKAKTIDEIANILARFAKRWDNSMRHIIIALAIFGVALSLMVGGVAYVGYSLFEGLHDSRIDVTEARCNSDNRQNRRVTDVVIAFTPPAKREEALRFMHQAFPIEPDCHAYATHLIESNDPTAG